MEIFFIWTTLQDLYGPKISFHFKMQSNLNRWQEKAGDDMGILNKRGKENVLSCIRINLLCPLPTRSLRAQVIRAYKNSQLRKFIMEMDKREEPVNRYLCSRKCRMWEFVCWRLCLPDIAYRKTVIHDNHDLAIAGYPGYLKT